MTKIVSNKKWQARAGTKLDIHASSNKKLKNYTTNMVRVYQKRINKESIDRYISWTTVLNI